MANEATIIPLDPQTFEYQDYSQADESIIATSNLDTAFTQSTDYIEYYIYDENKNLLFPDSNTIPLTDYSIKEGDVLLDPQKDVFDAGYVDGNFINAYYFYRAKLGSSPLSTYYIENISSDRTELQLRSNIIDNETIVSSSNDFISYRDSSDFFVDFYVNFGVNRYVIANNIQLDNSDPTDVRVLIKLYDPLPSDFGLKTPLWVVEEISTPQVYKVEIPVEEFDVQDFKYLDGPNLSINVSQEVGKSSDTFSYETLTQTSQTSSLQQLNSLLSEKGININVDYTKYSNFVKFSSAEERLKNFYFKASLIEETKNTLSSSIYNITGSTTGSTSFSSSKSSLESIIDSTIENFDGYEYYLYYNSGSKKSWPKTGSFPPYTLLSTGSTEVLTWYGSKNDGSIYYGGEILSSSLYDEDNVDWLYRTIPEYLVEDPENEKYELFIDMIGQHFDNIWVYTKDVTNRFNADNRLDYGISKDLVADAIKDFGIKLYSNNYDDSDLFQAFLGITSEGSNFPVPNITSSLPVPSGSGLEYVDTLISASSETIPQNDVQRSIYKRLYHNLPYLLKTKGTHQGLRVLLNSFGIPETILDSQEYGGAARIANNYDENVPIFNYALDFDGAQSVVTDWSLNTDWSASSDVPNSLFLRFKAETLHSSSTGPTNNLQTLFSLDTGTTLGIEYTGSSGIVASYSGSIVDPEYQYAKVILYPNDTATESGSVYLPVLNGDWFSVMINFRAGAMDLYAGSKSSPYQQTQQVGYYESSSIVTTGANWIAGTQASYGAASAPFAVFSGSMQEIRYYAVNKSENAFKSFIMNPTNFEGQSDSTAEDELAFRATLGTELYTGSVSVHPKLSGSWQV